VEINIISSDTLLLWFIIRQHSWGSSAQAASGVDPFAGSNQESCHVYRKKNYHQYLPYIWNPLYSLFARLLTWSQDVSGSSCNRPSRHMLSWISSVFKHMIKWSQIPKLALHKIIFAALEALKFPFQVMKISSNQKMTILRPLSTVVHKTCYLMWINKLFHEECRLLGCGAV
jgi:hypothetical protein